MFHHTNAHPLDSYKKAHDLSLQKSCAFINLFKYTTSHLASLERPSHSFTVSTA